MPTWRRQPQLSVARAERLSLDRRRALTAAVQQVQPPSNPSSESQQSWVSRQINRTPAEWQREIWDFYDTLGELRQGINWKANLASRVRLRAARTVPNQDEPEIINDGPAHDLVRELGGGIGGQAELMSTLSVQLSVPGECYLIGEKNPDGTNKWYVRSLEEVRPSALKPSLMSVSEGAGRWRTLPEESYVARIFRPHKRWHGVADSPCRACRPLLRELELVNRHIQAQYLSRLASAGIVVFPEEVTFPIRPEFADAPDPFVAEWIEIAAEAVRTPGTASSMVPIPMRVPGEYVDKIRHIDFTLKLDDTIIAKRNSGLARLAIELDMPPEALLGVSGVNHWNAWLIDEQGVKIHVAPDVEIICNALTEAYLWPRLQAMGEDPSQLVVWYDASELVLRPDRSEAAQQAYDRFEISPEAYRRETGFDESDAPNDDELRTMILKFQARQPVNGFEAMDELGLPVTHDTPPTEPRPSPEPAPTVEPRDGRTPPPDDQENPRRPGANDSERRRELQLLRQAQLEHALRINLGGYTVLHPQDCTEHLFGCPVTHATWRPVVRAMPGTSGVYRCWLNAYGQPILGELVTDGSAVGLVAGPTRKRPA